MKIKLSDLKPNPNRDLQFNPYNEEKITALINSINETGFWTNVIVRRSPDGKGYEQAYGHHRVEAARRTGITEADFVVQELDENMMLKMMELENQEDYRYNILSMLESVKAVVRALAEGRIAPFYAVETGELPPVGDPERYRGTTKRGSKWEASLTFAGEQVYLGTFDEREKAAQAYRDYIKGKLVLVGIEKSDLRLAPMFTPSSGVKVGQTSRDSMFSQSSGKKVDSESRYYTATDIAKFLGRVCERSSGYYRPDPKVTTALDALYLMEVKAIKPRDIQEMNWSQASRFVSDIKAKLIASKHTEEKTRKQLTKVNEESLRIQAEKKEWERKEKEKHDALVKKLAEAKKEEDRKAAKALQEKMDAQDKEREDKEESFKEKEEVIEKKVKQIKQEAIKKTEEDKYRPIRMEVDRVVRVLERRDEEEELKILSHKNLNPNDREKVRQAALKKGEWLREFIADLFLPPLSVKKHMVEYQRREETKRRAEGKK